MDAAYLDLDNGTAFRAEDVDALMGRRTGIGYFASLSEVQPNTRHEATLALNARRRGSRIPVPCMCGSPGCSALLDAYLARVSAGAMASPDKTIDQVFAETTAKYAAPRKEKSEADYLAEAAREVEAFLS